MNIDRAFVISIKKSNDRRKQFMEYNKNTFGGDGNLEVFLVDRQTNPTKGNYESHMNVIRVAKYRHYKTILVFEDDAVPIDEKCEDIIYYVNKFLENPPKDWKILTLGYLPMSLSETDDNNLYKVNCAYDAHAYLVNVPNVDVKPWNGVALDSHLFCNDVDPRYLPMSVMNDSISGVYAHYPMLYKQKAESSDISDMDLYQDYFFNIFGYNGSAVIASHINIVYIIIGIILIILILVYKMIYRSK